MLSTSGRLGCGGSRGGRALPRGQVRHVTNLARASAEAGVEHFGFGGVGGSNRDTGVPHFESCNEIEGNIRNFGLPVSFLRPVFFM